MLNAIDDVVYNLCTAVYHQQHNNAGILCFNLFLFDDSLFSGPERELYANVSEEFRIAWIWAICIAFSVPEFGTFFRSARICFFRNIRKASWGELLTVF